MGMRRNTEAIDSARSLPGGGKEYATGRQRPCAMLRLSEWAKLNAMSAS